MKSLNNLRTYEEFNFFGNKNKEKDARQYHQDLMSQGERKTKEYDILALKNQPHEVQEVINIVKDGGIISASYGEGSALSIKSVLSNGMKIKLIKGEDDDAGYIVTYGIIISGVNDNKVIDITSSQYETIYNELIQNLDNF